MTEFTTNQMAIIKETAQEAAEAAVKETVPAAVRETLENLGADISDKQEMQKDFHFVRSVRTMMSHAITKLFAAVLIGLAGYMVLQSFNVQI